MLDVGVGLVNQAGVDAGIETLMSADG